MSIKTLKSAKVGDKVSMLAFTGMNVGQFAITKAGKTKVAILCKDGQTKEFSRETGLQTNAANPKYANKIIDPIPEPEKKAPVKKAKPKPEPKPEPNPEVKKKKVGKFEKVEIPDDADDFEEEDLEDEEFEDDFEEFEEE